MEAKGFLGIREGVMLTKERRDAVYQMIEQEKSVLVKDLCERFDVTNETIRKDLIALEKEGRILRAYGGAYIIEGVKNEVHAELRASLYPEEKRQIGKACAGMIHSGDTIFLDESTTCQAIAKELKELEDLTVFTNSGKVFAELKDQPNARLVCLGGEYDRKNQSFVGRAAIDMLKEYYLDMGFLSCRGLDMKSGLTDGGERNGAVRRCLLNHAGKIVLAVDHTKLDLKKYYKISDFAPVDVMVIDRFKSKEQQKEWEEFLGRNQTRLIVTESQECDL